jgi:protein-S-isoprenylcysteine O-methyltransferase Ste14
MSDNPFEPGASVLENADVGPSGFEPPMTAVVMALYASAGVDAVQIPMAVVLENTEENLMLWGAVGVAQIAVFILTVVLWCRWKMRAARNIRVFSDRHSSSRRGGPSDGTSSPSRTS